MEDLVSLSHHVRTYLLSQYANGSGSWPLTVTSIFLINTFSSIIFSLLSFCFYPNTNCSRTRSIFPPGRQTFFWTVGKIGAHMSCPYPLSFFSFSFRAHSFSHVCSIQRERRSDMNEGEIERWMGYICSHIWREREREWEERETKNEMGYDRHICAAVVAGYV